MLFEYYILGVHKNNSFHICEQFYFLCLKLGIYFVQTKGTKIAIESSIVPSFQHSFLVPHVSIKYERCS